MTIWKKAKIYITRNKVRTTILILILIAVFLGELAGCSLYNIAKEGEKKAFKYNGAALYLSGENLQLNKEDYKKIKSIDGVLGVRNWKEILVTPLDTENVKEHIGAEPEKNMSNKKANQLVIVALMDIPLYSDFQLEENVSLIDGVFPNEENKGILVEAHYAKQNNLAVGEEVKFQLDDYERDVSYTICGIYEVDTQFEITEENTEGDAVYIHSPFNVIYMDYAYAQESINFENDAKNGCGIYVETISQVENIKTELLKLFGNTVEIEDNSDGYLEGECSVVTYMKNISQLLCVMMLGIGMIILLIVLSFFVHQFQYDVGIYQAVGVSKLKNIILNSIIMGTYIVVAIVIAYGIFYVSTESLVNYINEKIVVMIKNNTMSDIIYSYYTPGFREGFSLITPLYNFF